VNGLLCGVLMGVWEEGGGGVWELLGAVVGVGAVEGYCGGGGGARDKRSWAWFMEEKSAYHQSWSALFSDQKPRIFSSSSEHVTNLPTVIRGAHFGPRRTDMAHQVH
jgi:hypothetical protein